MRLFLLLSVIICSCQASVNHAPVDSLGGQSEAVIRERLSDSMSKDLDARIYVGDTSNLSSSPIEVISFEPVIKEGTTDKNISITYKNVSGKNIAGIKFSWHCLDVFGDPANLDGEKGYGSGVTDQILKSGKTVTNIWNVSSENLKKIVSVWPYEVAFEDGSKWKASRQSN